MNRQKLDGINYGQDVGQNNGYKYKKQQNQGRGEDCESTVGTNIWKEHSSIWKYRCDKAHEDDQDTTEVYYAKLHAIYDMKYQIDQVGRLPLAPRMKHPIMEPKHSPICERRNKAKSTTTSKIINHSFRNFFYTVTRPGITLETDANTTNQSEKAPKDGHQPPKLTKNSSTVAPN